MTTKVSNKETKVKTKVSLLETKVKTKVSIRLKKLELQTGLKALYGLYTAVIIVVALICFS